MVTWIVAIDPRRVRFAGDALSTFSFPFLLSENNTPADRTEIILNIPADRTEQNTVCDNYEYEYFCDVSTLVYEIVSISAL